MQKSTKQPEPVKQEMATIEEIIQAGAQQMLATALEAEIQGFLDNHSSRRLPDGRQAVVRNGYHDTRIITTGRGSLPVQVPRTRSRDGVSDNFVSSLIPRYLRKSAALDDALPYFYLAGLSNGEFVPCFEKLFGPDAGGVSSASVTRLKVAWQKEMETWQRRSLKDKRYVYLWVDGIHFNLRLSEGRLCVLVAIGARADGGKELVAVAGGYRESSESWAALLRDLRDRGMADPNLCIGDGALGFWKAAKDVFPDSEWQRCWVHKTANVLDKLPKSIQPAAKQQIHEMYRSETQEAARTAYARFIRDYEAKHPQAVACLKKDEDSLFTFYRFPAEQWRHIRSTNVIESTFATVRLRTKRTRGHGTLSTTLAMAFKLVEKASKKWRKLRGSEMLRKVISGVAFKDGKVKEKLAA